MADRKSNLLVTMVFDENLDIGKQIDTELALKNEIIKDLQHLINGKEIKHFVVADNEVINEKLTEERKVGKCTDCNEYNHEKHYCPKFCDVIRDTTKEMQEFYKDEHEKLERIEQAIKKVNCYYPLDTISEIEDILKQE